MFGFVIGALSLYGLIKVLRWGGRGACGGGYRRGWHGHGWGGHHGAHGWNARDEWRGHDDWRGHERGGEGWGVERNTFWLRGLFSRLDTTPGQEKVIRQAAQEIFAATAPLKAELDETRRDLAKALRTGTVDAVAMGELFARHDEKLRDARTAFVGALAKVSEALDEDQRKRLADLIDREGGHGWAFGGPYRGN
jgi:hypothetical protein